MTALFHTLLNPVDFSACSNAAHRMALALAAANGARLVVLHVSELVPVQWDPGFGLGSAAQIEAQIRADARRKLDELSAAAPGSGMTTELRRGFPANEILAAAKRCKTDLIVLGTHGRTGVSRLLMGSVAEKVTRAAACSVLTVHAAPAAGRRGKSGKK
jgi:nucleotide-binding universal stress UspA family protein